MNINWDDIQYIFQLPLQWFKTISNKVFNAYGTNFLTIKDGMYGGIEFGVDEDGFADAVNRAVDLSGYVTIDTDQTITGQKTFTKYVDVHHPTAGSHVDISPVGNIEIYTAPTSQYGGYIDFHNAGTSADYTSRIIDSADMFQITKSDSGMIQLYARGTGQVNLHAAANLVTLDNQPTDTSTTSLAVATVGYCQSNFGKVKTVNGTWPDSNGNVAITIPAQIVKTVDHKSPDIDGNIQLNAIRTINGKGPNSVGELTGVVMQINDETPDETGKITLNIPELPKNIVTTVNGYAGDVVLGPIVNSVNDIAPINGNVSLGSIVNSVNGIAPINGDVTIDTGVSLSAVKEYVEQQGFATSAYVDTKLTSYVDKDTLDNQLNNYALTSDLDAYAHTVDGHQAVDGEVDFGLLANKWVKTDSNGNLDTTSETPITLSSGNNGYLYSNNGTLQFKDEDYVTLSTAQDISGKKRFTQNDVIIVDNSLLLVDTSTNNGTSISQNGVTINSTTPFIDFSTPGTTANDAFIAMTAASGNKLGVDSPNGIVLGAPANQATLKNQPTDQSTDSLAIATCGYVQSQLSGVTNSNLKVITGVTWNGTQIVVASQTWKFNGGILTATTNNANTFIDTVAYSPT